MSTYKIDGWSFQNIGITLIIEMGVTISPTRELRGPPGLKPRRWRLFDMAEAMP